MASHTARTTTAYHSKEDHIIVWVKRENGQWGHGQTRLSKEAMEAACAAANREYTDIHHFPFYVGVHAGPAGEDFARMAIESKRQRREHFGEDGETENAMARTARVTVGSLKQYGEDLSVVLLSRKKSHGVFEEVYVPLYVVGADGARLVLALDYREDPVPVSVPIPIVA